MTFDEPEPTEAIADETTEIPLDEGLASIVGLQTDAPAEVSFVVPPAAYHAIGRDDSTVVAAVDAPNPLLGVVAALGETLGTRLDALTSAFEREIRAESTREKVVDRLHAELQEYKNDLLLNVLRPVFVDLIQLHDDIGKIVASQAEPSEDAGRLLELMRGFQQGIEDILYRQGVEPFSLDDDSFDPRRQRAFSTVTTDDPELNKQVANRLRKGFRSGGKVIRPEIVSVYAIKR
jgi:molecular chaperone GrpE